MAGMNTKMRVRFIDCIILGLLCRLKWTDAAKRWYYTGKSLNSNYPPNPSMFIGSETMFMSLFPSHEVNKSKISCICAKSMDNSTWYVHSGHIVRQIETCSVLETEGNADSQSQNISAVIGEKILIFLRKYIPETSSLNVYGVNVHNLAFSMDYSSNATQMGESLTQQAQANPYVAEIGLKANVYTNKFEQLDYIPILIGQLLAIVAVEEIAISENNKHSSEDNSIIHHYIITTDMQRANLALVMHTWQPLSKHAYFTDVKHVKVMSYNIWHNNPPKWKFPIKSDRWNRYTTRMRYLANIISKENADIILLQEVRLDNTFTAIDKNDYGSQVDHLLDYLKEIKSYNDDQSKKDIERGYHVIYHPSMLQFDRSNLQFRERIEEGLTILSRYPIKDASIFLLPRNFHDPRDDHQRGLLHASIMIPFRNTNGEESEYHIDAYNTHLSLSEESRLLSMHEIRKYSNKIEDNISKRYDRAHILGGDFNSEFSEVALQTFIKNRNLCADASYHSSGKLRSSGDEINNLDSNLMTWEDVWCTTHVTTADFINTDALKTGYTFPSHRPEKRIDFIFLNVDNKILKARSSKVIGSIPHLIYEEDIIAAEIDSEGNVVAREPDLLDPNGPIWASDHYGVIAEFELQ